ncbi:hypothetical protein BC834DRAFT_829324, partial [Gloeopeniophorella convolvens]
EEWTSILRLSTRWGFASIRDLAIRSIEPPTPYDRLLLARKYTIDQWITPTLVAMCGRDEPLTLDEARLMELEDVVLIGSVRECVRSRKPSAVSDEIHDCIVAWRRGEPWSPKDITPGPPSVQSSRPPSPVPAMCPRPTPTLGLSAFGSAMPAVPSVPSQSTYFGSSSGSMAKARKK